jgi:CheY-like chemotaxis protein
MSKNILWLDNDPAQIGGHVSFLRDQPEPYDIIVAPTITEAEKALADKNYDLLILDAMIPTVSEEEEKAYPPDQTQRGLKTGLAFYIRHQQRLKKVNSKVLVLTARIDPDIKQGFAAAGLAPEHIVEKAEIGKVDDLLEKIEEVLGEA